MSLIEVKKELEEKKTEKNSSLNKNIRKYHEIKVKRSKI